MTRRWASSRLRARSTWAEGAASRRAARIFEARLLLGFEHKNAPALFGILRMRRGRFVHNAKEAELCDTLQVACHALTRHACFRTNEKHFFPRSVVGSFAKGESAFHGSGRRDVAGTRANCGQRCPGEP